MPGTTQGRAAGFAYAWWQKSTSGVPTVLADLSAGAANATGLNRLYAAQSADFAFPEDEVVPIEGDDDVDGQFLFPAIELINFTLTVGRTDHALTNAIQGTAAEIMQTTWELNFLQPANRLFTDMFLLLTRRAQDGASSAARYENFITPLATMSDLGTAFQTRAAAAQNFKVAGNRVTKTFYGKTLTNNSPVYRFYSNYPVMIDVWKENGVATTFAASKTPKTGGTHLGFSWDGSGVPVTKAITKSSGSFTFTAGTNNHYIIALYEWE